jgi:biopolymer transport protein ExbD
MASSTSRHGELIHGINVTPLVDVVLVLLIVLMLTASYTVSRALPVQLPTASTGEASASTTLAISVSAAGHLYLDGAAVSKQALGAELRKRAKSGQRYTAVIAADGGAQHRSVVGVLDELRRAGVTQFAINVAPEERAP